MSQQLVRPPVLNTGESRSASKLELFFDLAYVFVVAELATALAKDLTWHGIGVFAGMFSLIWFSWVGFTLYANRFDTDDVVFRVAKLAATLCIAGCAASAGEADGKQSTAFAACYLLARVLLLGLHLRAYRHVPDARRTVGVYVVAVALTCVLWSVSLVVPGPARYVLWGVALLVDAVAPVVATLRGDATPLHMEHLPERFGLLVILVLGEGVAACVAVVHDAHWTAPVVLGAVAAFVVLAGLWWNYFDAGAQAGQANLHRVEQRAERGEEAATERYDLFVYGHLPLAMGIAAAAVGLEVLVLHPDDHPAASQWLLAGGLAAFALGLVAIVAGTSASWRRAWPWPGVGVLLPLLIAVPQWSGRVAVLVAAVLAVACAAVGTHAFRDGDLTTAPGDGSRAEDPVEPADSLGTANAAEE